MRYLVTRIGVVAFRSLRTMLGLALALIAIAGPVYAGVDPPSAPEIEGLSSRFLRQCRVFPLALAGNVLTVAMADPLDFETIAAVRAFSGLEVRTALCGEQEVLVLPVGENLNGQSLAQAKVLAGRGALVPPPGDERGHAVLQQRRPAFAQIRIRIGIVGALRNPPKD